LVIPFSLKIIIILQVLRPRVVHRCFPEVSEDLPEEEGVRRRRILRRRPAPQGLPLAPRVVQDARDPTRADRPEAGRVHRHLPEGLPLRREPRFQRERSWQLRDSVVDRLGQGCQPHVLLPVSIRFQHVHFDSFFRACDMLCLHFLSCALWCGDNVVVMVSS
jgi:hypothetical protein